MHFDHYENIEHIELEEQDTHANRHILKCMGYTAFALVIAWLMAILGIFVINQRLFTITVLHTLPVLLVPWIVCHFTGFDGRWVKYMLLAVTEVSLLLVGTMLTFHAVLLFALPLLYAAQYRERSFIYLTYVSTVVALLCSVMLGYYFGLCDMNMLLLSDKTTAYYTALLQSDIDIAQMLNRSPWATLPLLYVLPRSMILLLFVPVVCEISDGIAKNAIRTADLLRLSERDHFTRLYNKDKFMQLAEDFYPKLDHIAVIFWDVNDLKKTNDTYGHSYGDELITTVADCIRPQFNQARRGFRVGGDEFIMVLDNPGPGDVAEVIAEFDRLLAVKNAISKIKFSAAVGWAEGPGEQIQRLVQEADAAMYRDKAEHAPSHRPRV